MGADIDHAHPEVADDMIKWGKWIIEDLGVDGFRFDAVKVSACYIMLHHSPLHFSALEFILFHNHLRFQRTYAPFHSTSTATLFPNSFNKFAQIHPNQPCSP